MKYMKLGSKPDAFQSDENNVRYVSTELASDIVVNVGDVKFYLHKFPLLSKSSFLKRLVASIGDSGEEIDISDIPGGPAAFEICAKFCYGMIVTLNAYNVVAARCAAEYLEMHENNERGNLVYKIEVFLNSSIFRSWKDSIVVLQTTRSLLPWSEDLKLVSHSVDSVASKASIDPSNVEWSYTYNRRELPSENSVDSQWNGVIKQQSVPKDWWVEDLCELDLEVYKRVILAIKSKGRVSVEVIGEALRAYTYKMLPGFAKSSSLHGDANKSRTLLETIIWLLPTDPCSVSCSFMLKLLRTASLLCCSETVKKELVKRIGRQLHEASLIDLLISAPEGENAIYDVDLVLSIVEEFAMQEHHSDQNSPQRSQELQEIRSPAFVPGTSKLAVAQLIDGYLAEIAKDPNLPLSKFLELAELVPGMSRPIHDGLYRAIDMYLKEHPGLTKSERKKLCSLMDCKKLSPDACMHAVQNERLPLRVVVQILFFKQVRASAGSGGDLPPSVRSVLARENGGGSYDSSRSGTTTNTTNDDDWNAVGNSLNSMKLVGRTGGSERSSRSSSENINKNNIIVGDSNEKNTSGKAKGAQMASKKLLSKLWSSKGQRSRESSSGSDTTSESPGSLNQLEGASNSKSAAPSRNVRHSVS